MLMQADIMTTPRADFPFEYEVVKLLSVLLHDNEHHTMMQQ
jgi:hypothetical protein